MNDNIIDRGELVSAFNVWYLALREALEKGETDMNEVKQWAIQYAGRRVGRHSLELAAEMFDMKYVKRIAGMPRE